MKGNGEYITIRGVNQSMVYDYVRLTPDRQIPLHSQNNWELSCIITGEGTRLIAETSESFRPGETVLIPPGIPHCWYFSKDKTDADGNIENITITFTTDFLDNICHCFPELSDAIHRIRNLSDAIVLSGENSEKIYSAMLQMLTQTKENRVLSLIEILLTIAQDNTGRQIIGIKQMRRSEIRLSQVRSYVNCNYVANITIEDISRHLGMNRSSFCSFFKRETGETFTGYLNKHRLSIACEMLCSSDRQIGEIASAVGLHDLPYFCRIFKKHFGMSPKEYRKSRQKCR